MQQLTERLAVDFGIDDDPARSVGGLLVDDRVIDGDGVELPPNSARSNTSGRERSTPKPSPAIEYRLVPSPSAMRTTSVSAPSAPAVSVAPTTSPSRTVRSASNVRCSIRFASVPAAAWSATTEVRSSKWMPTRIPCRVSRRSRRQR